MKSKIIIIVIVIVALGLGAYFVSQKSPSAPAPIASISGDTADFVSFSITPGATISGTMTATGSVKGAYFNEANARGMLLDANKNVIKMFSITATGEWMTSDPVAFTTTFDTTGAPSGAGYIRIANDNPSGDPSRDKYIDIPVVFQ